MDLRRKTNKRFRFLAREDGAVAVEMVILFPLFLLILAGIMEFGHLWYVDHVITNASREGARAAVVYVTDYDPYADRTTWAQNAATAAVTNYLSGKLPGVSLDPTTAEVTLSPKYEVTGGWITVTIEATNAALILDLLNIPGFKNLSVTAATTMRME